MTLLPEYIGVHLKTLGGIATLDDLSELGANSDDIAAWVRGGELRRVRRGAYVDARTWQSADQVARSRLETRARARSVAHRGLVAAGHTAAAVWGLPLLGRAAATIELARTGAGPSEHIRDVRIQCCWGPGSGTNFAGVPVLHLAPTLISHATCHGVEAGVVAIDASLHDQRVGIAELQEWLLPNIGRRGIRAAREAIRLADGSAESPGESRTRLLLASMGLEWRAQEWIETDRGGYRVDFLVGDNVVVEFDGAVKYEGAEGREALVAEKQREDALRRAGYVVVRVVWKDLADPARFVRLLEPALHRLAS